jgi:hypothetical protein
LECQNRSRTSKDILHKIQHIRNKHWRKTFIFCTRRRFRMRWLALSKARAFPTCRSESFWPSFATLQSPGHGVIIVATPEPQNLPRAASGSSKLASDSCVQSR